MIEFILLKEREALCPMEDRKNCIFGCLFFFFFSFTAVGGGH